MGDLGIDPQLLHAWLSARSVARGLPLPVPDRGGFRVDTNSDAERVRWVFPGTGPGLAALARTIDEPGHLLKLCGTADALRAVLPARWVLHGPSYFMQAAGRPAESPGLPRGYRIALTRVGAVVQARILSAEGVEAASGYAAEADGAFVYDRIGTAPGHRRKGLGRALMMALRGARREAGAPEVLVATEEGRALYAALGWVTLSPYSTAAIGTAGVEVTSSSVPGR